MAERIQPNSLERLRHIVEQLGPSVVSGKVTEMVGIMARATCPAVSLGELCSIEANGEGVLAEVVGFKGNVSLLMPLTEPLGIRPGARVIPFGRALGIRVGDALLGRVLNGLGRPVDGNGPVSAHDEVSLWGVPPQPLSRQRIAEPLPLGVRAIDGLVTCGKGQRMGIFAGSGVGKSTLLGMIARNTHATVNVIALIGERGREVREFLERDLGDAGRGRSVVVVATSDESPLMRMKAALSAITIAEYFRDQGLDVLFMMDSLTRFAMAQREVGLAAGELPTSRGYTPSVFSVLPKFLERAGASDRGTITALCTVLVEADDFNEPISDHARAILDGHISLSRQLASRGHYPSIDVLHSVSRVMKDIVKPEHFACAVAVRELIAAYQEAQELVNIGAYKHGSNPLIDRSLELIDAVNAFLKQDVDERDEFNATVTNLRRCYRDS